jgi:hypothetical protein
MLYTKTHYFIFIMYWHIFTVLHVHNTYNCNVNTYNNPRKTNMLRCSFPKNFPSFLYMHVRNAMRPYDIQAEQTYNQPGAKKAHVLVGDTTTRTALRPGECICVVVSACYSEKECYV